MSTYTRNIGAHVVNVAPFASGARREACARVLDENLHILMHSRLGLQDEPTVRAINRKAMDRIADALLCADHSSIRLDGQGDPKALTQQTVADLPTEVLLPLLAYAWQVNYLTETL
ncbi:hypothetical protein [Lichenicoccus roseus]|uniref:Uncharacterized protein n=1 Tax=Lichenicoccus roseus TaxID=2683649 RepID=A0A5R9J279_9PROT|nr:hypothetical protein [Lichenicoccus roseus]TLU70587.1 hypothetical protein FE263_21110 [Lichenicoccus roseus]